MGKKNGNDNFADDDDRKRDVRGSSDRDRDSGSDDWEDGADFDPRDFAQKGERTKGEDSESDDEDESFGGKAAPKGGGKAPEGMDAKDSSEDAGGNGEKPQLKMEIKPHESGAGHTVKLHDDVEADLPEDGDYQHHVREYAKHHAGYLVHKDSDPEKSEAHRQAANIHARIGNALHAGGDTSPRKGQAALGQPGAFGQPGAGPQGQQPGGLGEPEEDGWQEGADYNFDEPSPGQDAAGGEIPAKPDKARNAPPRDSLIEGNKALHKQASPPLKVVGKSLSKATGHKYTRRVADGKGGWRYYYDESTTKPARRDTFASIREQSTQAVDTPHGKVHFLQGEWGFKHDNAVIDTKDHSYALSAHPSTSGTFFTVHRDDEEAADYDKAIAIFNAARAKLEKEGTLRTGFSAKVTRSGNQDRPKKSLRLPMKKSFGYTW